jgi:heme A synthase
MPLESQPSTFSLAVRFHLLLAGVLALHVTMLTWLLLRHCRSNRQLVWLSFSLVGLLVVQVALGAATWVVKYAVPAWATGWVPSNFANQAGSWLQTNIVTGHVAIGSLLLGTSVAIALLALRQLGSPAATYQSAPSAIGAAT